MSTTATKTNYVAKAERYCRRVAAGEVAACRWVKLACARHLSDRQREKSARFPFRFDRSKAEHICRFAELLPHVKGPLAGGRIKLEPWQCFILCCVFGWLRKDNGKRRFRRSYVEVPRGNAKSTLSSAVGLYMLALDDEGGSEVYSAATTREQAKIVFRDAQEMARKSPGFLSRFGVDVLAHAIIQPKSASKFVALSAEADTLDGLNVHCAIVDELHAHPTRRVYDVLETGMGKRDQSLLWLVTTAGSDLSGICYEVRTYATKILEGIAPDDSTFAIIYTLDEGDDWQSDAALAKANPNIKASIDQPSVRQLRDKAKVMPAAQANYKTKHLDVWVSAMAPWLPMEAWHRCGTPPLRLEDFEGQPCVIGLDLASKTDIAAAVHVFRPELGRYAAFGRFYLPEAAIRDGRNSQYTGWEASGRLVVTPGEEIDFGRIKSDLLADASLFEVREIAYDPWQAKQLSQELTAEGASVVEFRNTVANMSEPMKELDAAVRSCRLGHDGCPVFAWMASNVVARMDAKENIYPRKERPGNKIDGIVALIMALGRWLALSPAKPVASIYESRGITLLGDDDGED